MKFVKEFIPYIIVIFIVVLIRSFIVTPVRVDGASMNPTLKDGDIMLLNKFDKDYKRFDIVVVDYNGTKLIKRIIKMGHKSIIEHDYLVFAISDPENIVRAVKGEKVGTIVS